MIVPRPGKETSEYQILRASARPPVWQSLNEADVPGEKTDLLHAIYDRSLFPIKGNDEWVTAAGARSA